MAPVGRDVYKSDVDFAALALQFPDFAKKLKPNRQLDFSDPESIRQLTKSLLLRDFDISLELPEDRLCPPVPNRLNYIFWLQDLLDSTNENYRDGWDANRQVLGLDLGTGASCIYPLIGCRQRSQWRFLATEIDEKSHEYAGRNIQANKLQARIGLLPRSSISQTLFPTAFLKDFERVDFAMTNPPFYSSEAEMLDSAKMKQRPPSSACTGAPIEMITDGGEVEFVSRLILESMHIDNRTRIVWFTSMLGKLSSVTTLVERLREKLCTNYAVTEFVQGQKTRRWAIAWSWGGLRPSIDVARGIPGLEKRILPFPSEYAFEISDATVDLIGPKLDQYIKALDLQWQWKSPLAIGMGLAKGDVWSRKARRRKEQKLKEGKTEDDDADDEADENEEPGLVFKVKLTKSENEDAVVLVRVRWMRGEDSVLFESFCGWLKRKIEAG